MKKYYTKPLLAYEDFQLACALAGDCELKLGHYSYQCTADFDEDGNIYPKGVAALVGLGEFFSLDTCYTDLTGPELDGGETYCYHGPGYTEGRIFLGS